MDKLAGKIALGIEGSADMALVTAKEFLEEGAFVVIAESRKRKLGAEVQRLRIDVRAIYADGGRLAHLERFYSDITKRNGTLEVVFANGDIYEIKPHDQAIEDAESLCFCRLRKRGSIAEFGGKRAVENGAPRKSPKAGLSHSAWKSRKGSEISTFSTAPATTGFLFDSTPKQNQPQNKNKTRRREEE